LLGVYVITLGLIVLLQEAHRRVLIVHLKRQAHRMVKGAKGPTASYIPFKINPSGVMPIIFTFALLSFPQTLIQLLESLKQGWIKPFALFYGRYLAAGTPGFLVCEFLLIVLFTFFYASIMPSMQPEEIAENLRKNGSSVPGVRPGKQTADYLLNIFSRITVVGAVGLACITLIASTATSITNISTLNGLGSTALIIMVGVALDTVNQIRVHLLVKQYQGFLKP
jgi:preprotein translocase subunit SecY